MMLYPPMNELLEKVDCRYTLVVETAKRARQLIAGKTCHLDKMVTTDAKPVSIAVEEIYQGKVEYHRLREGMR